jgi:hypothetical protein
MTDDIVTVYGVWKNSDMTEGRGPMVLDRLFITEERAWEYANGSLGVMGRKPFHDHLAVYATVAAEYQAKWADPICKGWACVACWGIGDVPRGDWQVRPQPLYT